MYYMVCFLCKIHVDLYSIILSLAMLNSHVETVVKTNGARAMKLTHFACAKSTHAYIPHAHAIARGLLSLIVIIG